MKYVLAKNWPENFLRLTALLTFILLLFPPANSYLLADQIVENNRPR